MSSAASSSAPPLAAAASCATRNNTATSGLRLFAILLPLGLALTAFIMLRDNGAFGPMTGWWRGESGRAIVRIARSGASLALGLAYVGDLRPALSETFLASLARAPRPHRPHGAD